MSHQLGIPKAAPNSLIQMVDYDAQVKPGMEFVILAHTHGLYGRDNLVGEQAISWTEAVVQSRGANCSVLWIDEVMKVHEWRLPPLVVKGAIANADLDRVRVQIVDDEIDFAATLAERLRLRDFDAQAVSGADEAMARIRGGWAPDLVLLDLKMPGVDGLATLTLLKREEPTFEAILLTGHGSTTAAVEGMQRGLFDYLMKPVDIGELVQKIRSAAARRARAAPP